MEEVSVCSALPVARVIHVVLDLEKVLQLALQEGTRIPSGQKGLKKQS